MNWYRRYKISSTLGNTIGKWLIQAKDGYVDNYSLTSDIRQSLQDDGLTSYDAGTLDAALSEAHSILVNSGQFGDYNNYQRSVVDFIRNMIYTESEQPLTENSNVV